MAKIKWADRNVVVALVENSISISDLLRKAGLSVVGANSQTVTKWIAYHQINTDHFELGYERVNQYNASRKRPHSEIFCEGSDVRQVILRREYSRLPDIEYSCVKCGNNGEWDGSPLTLQLDHINGVNGDNRIENLRWLCPNCHSQTETFAGRNSTKTISL